MIDRLADLFPVILASASAALIAAPLLIQAGRRLGLVDVPGAAPHKQHRDPTPVVGGVVLALSILPVYLILGPPIGRAMTGILLATAASLIFGLLDDVWDLRPYQKLMGQVGAALLLILFGTQVLATRVPGLDLALTIIWTVGMMNAFNFVDSMDGLALGLGCIAAAFFMLVTIDSQQPALAMLSAAVLGAGVGSFFFNASPPQMFLGDSGAQMLGLLLAALGIAYVPGQAGLPQAISWFTPILVLGMPIFDMALVVLSRVRSGRPVFRAARDHTFHRLVGLGLQETRAVLAMQIGAIMLGLIAFIALDTTVILANTIFGFIVLLGIGGLLVLSRAPAGSPGHGTPP